MKNSQYKVWRRRQISSVQNDGFRFQNGASLRTPVKNIPAEENYVSQEPEENFELEPSQVYDELPLPPRQAEVAAINSSMPVIDLNYPKTNKILPSNLLVLAIPIVVCVSLAISIAFTQSQIASMNKLEDKLESLEVRFTEFKNSFNYPMPDSSKKSYLPDEELELSENSTEEKNNKDFTKPISEKPVIKEKKVSLNSAPKQRIPIPPEDESQQINQKINLLKNQIQEKKREALNKTDDSGKIYLRKPRQSRSLAENTSDPSYSVVVENQIIKSKSPAQDENSRIISEEQMKPPTEIKPVRSLKDIGGLYSFKGNSN